MLRSRGIRNIAVVADARMVESSILNMGEHIKKASELYTLNTVLSSGAFHPKLQMYIGDIALLLLVGSGNITSGGMGKNHEVFTFLYADNTNKEQLPLIMQAWTYLKHNCSQFKGITEEQLRWMEQHCDLMHNYRAIADGNKFIKMSDGVEVAFLTNVVGTLWEKLTAAIEDAGATTKITIVSPYFDEGGLVLSAIRKHFTNAFIDVIVQPEQSLLPLKYIDDKQVSFFDWSETIAASDMNFRSINRFLHGKLFHFQSGDEEFLVIGSANATSRAFFADSRSNQEAILLLKGINMQWLNQLGITGHHESINILDYKLSGVLPIDSGEVRMRFKYKIDSVDIRRGGIKLYLSTPINEKIQLCLIDRFGAIVCNIEIAPTGNNFYSLTGHATNNVMTALYAVLRNGSEQISNSQIVNNEQAIWNNNPSPENRRILHLLSKIAAGEYNELDLFDYYDAIYNEGAVEKPSTPEVRNRGVATAPEDKNLTYEEAKALFDTAEILHSGNEMAPNVLTAYLERLQQEITDRQNEDIDDEEDGDLSTGAKREQKEKKVKPFSSERVFVKMKEKISKVYGKYAYRLIERIENTAEEYYVSQSDYAFFLLSLSHLIAIAGKEQRYLIRKDEVTGILMPFKGAVHEYASFHGIVLNVIGKFILFLKSSKGSKAYTNEYDVERLKYFRELSMGKILLCLTLINMKCGGYGDRDEKWKKLILLSVLDVYGASSLDVRSLIEKQLKLFDIEDMEIADSINYVADLYANTLQLYHTIRGQDLMKNIETDRLVCVNEVGFCYIEECLPNAKAPKSLKLSNLGFEYDAVDFVGGKVYNILNDKFYQMI